MKRAFRWAGACILIVAACKGAEQLAAFDQPVRVAAIGAAGGGPPGGGPTKKGSRERGTTKWEPM
jgi:hypothetical protein